MFELSSSRNRIILFAALGVVLVLAVLYLLLMKQPPPLSEDDVEDVDDVVDVIVGDQRVSIPKDFQETLRKLRITGLALISTEEGNGHTLRAITIDGTYRDLCGPRQKGSTGGRSCKLDTTVKALVSVVSGADECGECFKPNGDLTSCHRAGDLKNKRKCHSKRHRPCADSVCE